MSRTTDCVSALNNVFYVSGLLLPRARIHFRPTHVSCITMPVAMLLMETFPFEPSCTMGMLVPTVRTWFVHKHARSHVRYTKI